MKQASFKFGETVNKGFFSEKNKNNVEFKVSDKSIDQNIKIDNNKNIITSSQPKKKVENIYYFD
jgi:hypothetical protein